MRLLLRIIDPVSDEYLGTLDVNVWPTDEPDEAVEALITQLSYGFETIEVTEPEDETQP